jgi:2-polyprenyl-3-methyl-5-hydroxy-6-metoxy-1,4-benzoquinol methylase
MTEPLMSPITQKSNCNLLLTLSCNQLIQDWKKGFGIDISEELKGYEEIKLYQCNQSKLRFFVPIHTAGSDQLYEQLEKYDWYYMPRKWEHDVAVKDLQGCQRVLEVGCGRGAFVERLCKEEKIDAQGIELNSNAVNLAKAKGINVYSIDLHELAKKKEKYDAVCSFQVLEHISDPLGFIEGQLKLIKPGGKLIIGVPNADSFMKYCKKNLLDQPPHHVTRWYQETFIFLESILPIRVQHFKTEPLADYHVSWYTSTQLSRLPQNNLFKVSTSRLLKYLINPTLRNLDFIRNSLKGMTLYVCYEKIESK